MAQWKFLERAYIGDRLVEPDEVLTLLSTFIPGYHMEPMDDEAHELVKTHADRMTPVKDVIDHLTDLRAEALQSAQAQGAAHGAAMAESLGKNMAGAMASVMAGAMASAMGPILAQMAALSHPPDASPATTGIASDAESSEEETHS